LDFAGDRDAKYHRGRKQLVDASDAQHPFRSRLGGTTAALPTSSAILMLDCLGCTMTSRRLDGAMSAVLAAGKALPSDRGGNTTTDAFADAAREAL